MYPMIRKEDMYFILKGIMIRVNKSYIIIYLQDIK
jgi:hypothetical protein